MGRSESHLTVAQFDLLRWVADGCEAGVYEGSPHRVSARALHNRGFLRVSGSGKTWAAQITPEGTRRLDEEAKRVEAERDRVRKEEQVKAEREREQQALRERAAELLRGVIAAGGRLDLGPSANAQDVERMRCCLGQARLLPEGQRLAQEPTRMDPVLGVTVYLEPDFEALTEVRSFTVPRQLRSPHPAVAAFQAKKALVSKSQMGRASRFLQALVHAATEVGWKVPAKVPNMSRGRGESGPDLALRLPSSGELVVVIQELDQRGRRAQPFVTEWDYYTRQERTVTNKYFQGSGNLEVRIVKAWQDQTVLSLRDTGGATLEDQLPVLIHKLEFAEAEAEWSRREESRRSEIRTARWEEVKQEAFTKLTYERNAKQLRKQLERRRAAAEMRAYADEVTACSAFREGTESEDALRWAEWIRQHADQTDPINEPLHLLRATSATHEELAPHMNGWNTYGPYRR